MQPHGASAGLALFINQRDFKPARALQWLPTGAHPTTDPGPLAPVLCANVANDQRSPSGAHNLKTNKPTRWARYTCCQPINIYIVFTPSHRLRPPCLLHTHPPSSPLEGRSPAFHQLRCSAVYLARCTKKGKSNQVQYVKAHAARCALCEYVQAPRMFTCVHASPRLKDVSLGAECRHRALALTELLSLSRRAQWLPTSAPKD